MLDWSDRYLSGDAAAVSIVLSEVTWNALIRLTGERYADGVFDAMPLTQRIELFFDELIYERVLCEEPSDWSSDDGGDDIPF
ncbi:hypothetical protein [Sphingobium yanoikuyae]|uniref:hypothetical protein n=1 Tax=Sphingobium yanoikuyae TaxID=13690 RepID=UPI00084783A3|nr:hypothetical protein [Sphingobium yanoikuyae]